MNADPGGLITTTSSIVLNTRHTHRPRGVDRTPKIRYRHYVNNFSDETFLVFLALKTMYQLDYMRIAKKQ